ncbi:acyltransferase [Flavitalea antarctica]
MARNSRIDHFTIAVNLSLITMEQNSFIGRSNWITGFPANTDSLHFRHVGNREASLEIGESTAITKNHHLDCTDRIVIGKFTTVAGYRSQFLTHSIDVVENRQDCSPIIIGDYTYVGTNVVILGGATLPSYSVLGAKSVLNKKFDKEWMLYAGVPAIEKKIISEKAKYFTRQEGYVL